MNREFYQVKFIFTNSRGEQVRRDYTPRRFDVSQQEVVLEFALHDGGDASDWACHAQLGDEVVIAGPKGSMIIPPDFDWHLFVADASGIPAVARRLEELPEHTKVIVFAKTSLSKERRRLNSAASMLIRWVEADQDVIELVEAMVLPEGEGFAWVAGEHAFVFQVKEALLNQGHPEADMKVAAYWKKDTKDFSEKG